MILIILVFALVIRWETVVQPRDFWIDESYQYAISQKSVSFIIDSPDVHPPLFNLFTKGLLSLGIDDPFHLRLVMVFLSLILIAVFFFAVKEMFNRNTAFYSSMLLSFCLTYIYYSTEFRSYTFTLIFVILQIKYLNRVLSKSYKDSTLYFGLFSLLMIYSHYMAGLVLFAEFVFLTINWKKIQLHRQIDLLSVLVWVFGLSIPLILYIIKTFPKIHSFWFKDIDLTSLLSSFGYILSPPIEGGILFLIFYPVIFFAIRMFRDKFDMKIQQFIYYLFIPIVLMWIISQVFPFYHHRYFLFGGLSFFILLGWAFDKFDSYSKDMGLFGVSIWLIFLIFTFPAFIGSFNTELFEANNYLQNITKSNDVFLHTTTFSYLPFQVFYPDNQHFLVTNLTTDQQFTCGGSVINPEDLKTSFDFVSEINGSIYGISDKKVFPTVLLNVRGLYVTKRN